MPSQAPNIGHLRNDVAWQFPLHSEIVLLNVGPGGMCGNSNQAQREFQSRSTDLVVGSKVKLVWSLHHRRRTLQRFSVALIAVRVLEENAVSAANRELPIAEDIVRKAETRRGIEKMPAHAALR